MKRSRSDSGTITGITEATAERVKLGGELLQALAHEVAENEKAQRRFRCVVLNTLSKIQTAVNMIHGAQIVEAHGFKPGHEERVREHAKATEEYISQNGHNLGLKMVKYIYNEHQAPPARHDRRRKWSDWVI